MKQILLAYILKYAKQLFESVKAKHEIALKDKVDYNVNKLLKIAVEQSGDMNIHRRSDAHTLLSELLDTYIKSGFSRSAGEIVSDTQTLELASVPSSPKLLVKKLNPAAQLPLQTDGNAGYDLYAVEAVVIPPGERRLVKTGIAMRTPPGYYASIRNRSGMSYKNGGDVLGGVFDHNYTGEVGVILLNTDKEKDIVVNIGDRPAQFILERYGSFEVELVEELPASERGEKGFGSSGS